MNNQAPFDWKEIEDTWSQSAEAKSIRIQVSDLINELKANASQFEKNSIKSDIAMLKSNWKDTQVHVSQFEKDMISQDLNTLKGLLKKFLKFIRRS